MQRRFARRANICTLRATAEKTDANVANQLRRCDRHKSEFRGALCRRAGGARDRNASPHRAGARSKCKQTGCSARDGQPRRKDPAVADRCHRYAQLRYDVVSEIRGTFVGTPGGQTLANNAAIEGHPAYGIEQITAAAGPLFDNANKLLNNLDVTVKDLKRDLDDFAPKLGPLADALKMDADHIQNVITNLDGLTKGADSVLGTADKFISSTDKDVQEQLKQLHVTLLNLKVVTTYTKELVETLAEKPNRVIFSGKPATLTPESEILKSSKPLPARKP